MKKIITLIVLDGWGLGSKDETNPIYEAKLETIDFLEKNFPAFSLQASGLALGLPYNEEGNSELGHMTIGAGRIIEGHSKRISNAIKDGSFFKNKTFLSLINWTKKYNSNLHLVGLLGSGNVHSSLEHLKAILLFLKNNSFQNYYLHLISDGRDSPPNSFSSILKEISSYLNIDILSKTASICGRYYAMDRDKRFERTEKAYKALVGETLPIPEANLDGAIANVYAKGLNDEYLECVSLEGKKPISENDAVFFFNFREDRMRQLAGCFVDKNFNHFPVKKFNNLLVATMVPYDKNFENPVIFPYIPLKNTLGEVISLNGKSQLRIAETEKYAHVTYFFNGLREEPFNFEYRILIPSSGNFRYNKNPEMMAKPITDRVLSALVEGNYDFILVNYANPDMVAHTGDFDATKAAVKFVDLELSRIVNTVLSLNHICIITSDHGNAETLIDNYGQFETKHNPNPVPLYFVGKEFQGQRSEKNLYTTIGMLSDLAPTILEIMKLPVPEEMTGQSLLPQIISY